ncbi:MAG: extracellular solute-binding protein [Pseudomonadota bacterium]
MFNGKVSRRGFLLYSGVLAAGALPAFARNESLAGAVRRVARDSGVNRLRLLYPEGALANINPIVASFSEQTGIGIELTETLVDDVHTKLLIEHTAGRSRFDLALPATYSIPDLAEAQAIRDLSRYVVKYEQNLIATPSLYALGDRYKNRFYGYQTDGDVYLMFYLRKRLEDPEEKKRYEDLFGEPLRLPETWAELDRIMSFFHRPDEDQYGGCLFRTPSYMTWEWWIRFHETGRLPLTDDVAPDFVNDEGVGALESLLAASAHQHPSAATNGLFENWHVFSEGQCAVNIGWGGSQKHFNRGDSKIKGDMLHATTPGASYFNWGWNFVTTSSCRAPELGFLFGLFATRPDVSLQAVREDGFFDPFREEHYADDQIASVYGETFLAAHRRGMRTAIPDFYLSHRDDYFRSLTHNIELAYHHRISAEEALRFTAADWERMTERFGRDSQRDQWRFLKTRYPVRGSHHVGLHVGLHGGDPVA